MPLILAQFINEFIGLKYRSRLNSQADISPKIPSHLVYCVIVGGILWVWSQPSLHSKFQANQGYIVWPVSEGKWLSTDMRKNSHLITGRGVGESYVCPFPSLTRNVSEAASVLESCTRVCGTQIRLHFWRANPNLGTLLKVAPLELCISKANNRQLD